MLHGVFDDLLRANRQYVSTYDLAALTSHTAKGFALVTCMDTRIDPLAILGLSPGDAKILRNAGGRVTDDVLRSLILATAFLGVTEIAVMHHTGCALAGRSEGQVDSDLKDAQMAKAIGRQWLAMPDPDAALRADVEAVRNCEPLAPRIRVEGWRYQVETGEVLRVVDL